MKNEDILKIARERFEASASSEKDNRDAYVRDTKFENGEQWDDAEIADRAGRPCIVVNKVAGAVKQILGDARKNRPRIKVRPVDSEGDVPVAQLINSLIKNIENISDAESAYDTGFECAVKGGIGYWRIITEYADDTVFDQEIKIERIVNPMSVYMDQSSTRTDYADAEHGFICENVPTKRFKKEYPKAQPSNWESSIGDEHSDWISEDTVRVAEYFYKVDYTKEIFELTDGRVIEIRNAKKSTVDLPDGQMGSRTANVVTGDGVSLPVEYRRSRKETAKKVMWCKINGHEILEGPTEWAGKYIPIIPCIGEETWIEGKRIFRSAVRHAIDAQKLYNWSRSNTVETLAMAPKQPYHLTPAEIEGHEDQWNEAHRKPQAYRLYNDVGNGRPQPSSPSIPNTGAYREAMVSSDDIKSTTGIFDASLGAQGNETSGRAILERKQQGSTASFIFSDNQARAIKYTAKVLVDLIPKIYDSERVVRLVNEDGSEAWARINVKDPVSGEVKNDLSVGRYDVTYDVSAAYATRREEAADGLLKVAQTAPQFLPAILPDIARNLDWPGAQELAGKLQQAQQQQVDPNEKMKVESELKGKEIELQGKQLENQNKVLDLEMKKIELMMKKADLDGKGLDNMLKDKELRTPIQVNQ
jgi:hypothetical protein